MVKEHNMGSPDGPEHCLVSKESKNYEDDTSEHNGFICKEHDNRNLDVTQATCLNLQSKDIHLFSSIDISTVGNGLTSLNINYNQLSELPLGLSTQLPNLRTFLADGNDLYKLPEDIADLSHLEELCLCENRLTSLPESLCKLKFLKILKVSANSLTHLHSEIGQNESLEILSVDENKLTRFPATLGLLKRLRVLVANNNKIETLPSTIHFLQNLNLLDLCQNNIEDLPDTFGELTNLKRIDFSYNRIVNLCPKFKSAPVLEYLYLDMNRVPEIPSWFSDLESVKEISLKTNELFGRSFPEGFGSKLKHLESFDLRGNYLEKLPSSFSNLTSIKTLLLGTPNDELERNPNFLNGNWLTELPEKFGNLKALTTLRLEENQLPKLPEDFGCLSNLVVLRLGANFIYELPASFTQLKSLKVCQLSKNRLDRLPNDFGTLTTIQELFLDSNMLRSLPESLANLTNLEILDLSENKLRKVPSNILSALTNLKALSMLLNRFEVHDSEIPQVRKPIHYEEKNPENKGNWRGRNNRPGVIPEVDDQISSTQDVNTSMTTESDDDEDEEIIDPESSDDDWDKEIENSDSSNSTPQCNPGPLIADDEYWDNDLPTPSMPQGSVIEPGQFDLDDDAPEPRKLLQSSPLTFDFYGNASKPLDLDIHHNKLLPYLLHAETIDRRRGYDYYEQTKGQFDSDGEQEEEEEDVEVIHLIGEECIEVVDTEDIAKSKCIDKDVKHDSVSNIGKGGQFDDCDD